MDRFEIKEEFLLNGQPFKILSGAIHYFRVDPSDWHHSLYNLKALGFNTVETYVPWNLHEPQKGTFHFEGILDLERFLKLAQELGLYAIVRPSPYICAEWEFGGFPAWLLNEPGRMRSNNPTYLKHVAEYYDVLMEKIVPHQLANGGNILMIQIENEYGSFGEEKAYLRAIRDLMIARGVTAPFFTSDGPWRATLRAGSMIEDDILVTGNFGSKAKENFGMMQAFFEEHGKKWPLMCMEFWDGWFNRWNQEIIKRDPQEFVNSAQEMLSLGSVNFYMFQGGTNFGWMNGCSARKEHDLPQITSYDYDAILTEYGAKTEKYHLLREVITGKKERLPERRQTKNYGQIIKNRSVSLFSTLDCIAACHQSDWPLTMEELDHYYGYVVYQHTFKSYTDDLRMRIIDGRDRAKIYLDDQEIATQYQEEIGDEINLPTHSNDTHDLKILMENMGRVNYGSKLQAETQQKGIRNGVILDIHFTKKWKHYCLNFEHLDLLNWENGYQSGPGFHEYIFEAYEVKETFIDLEGFGKGVVFVNGHHCGRFYEAGPTLSLYIPGPFLKKGINQIIIFETEGCYRDKIELIGQPKYL